MSGSGRRVVVFARAPVPGRVKSRLVPALGEAGAAALHVRLVERALDLAIGAARGPAQVELWCTPDTRDPFFAAIERDRGVTLRRQEGAGLGERMAAALRGALAEVGQAVLIGTDCADCRGGDLEAAFLALDGDAEAVLGPTLDGGYWLIGLKRWSNRPFQGIDWGSDRVRVQTRAALEALGWHWIELPLRQDVDRPADLAALDRHLLAHGSPQTWGAEGSGGGGV